jgi:uncharacterized C2H2 Zn-finger protein
LGEKRVSDLENRTCPYCGKALKSRPYWRHVEKEHPKQYATDKATWIQLFKDYGAMGMDASIAIQVICELFNQKNEDVVDFLRDHNVM